MKIKFDLYEVLNDRVTALQILKSGIKLIGIMLFFFSTCDCHIYNYECTVGSLLQTETHTYSYIYIH